MEGDSKNYEISGRPHLLKFTAKKEYMENKPVLAHQDYL